MPVLATGFEFGDWNFYERLGWRTSSLTPGFVGGSDSAGPRTHTTPSGAGGRRAWSTSGSATTPRVGDPATNRWVSFWFRREDPDGGNNFNVDFRVSTGNSSTNGTVQFQSDGNGGKVRILRTNAVLATSTNTLDNSIGHWVEIEINSQESPDGFCNVYVDGVLWVSATSVDLRNQGVDGWDLVQFGGTTFILDDVIITTVSEGQLSTEYYGVQQVITGNQSVALTPSSGSNWENVSGDVYDTTSYNETTSGAGQEDLYTTRRRYWVESVYCVAVSADVARAGQASDSGNNLQLAVRSGSTTGYSSTVTLGSTVYEGHTAFFDLNPDTSLAWTESDLDDLAVGVRTAT